MLQITPIPCLRDNYAYLLVDEAGVVAVVDPSESSPVLRALEEQNLSLDYVLNTHHHPDHVGGNLDLKEATGCKVVGHGKDAHRIPGIDIQVLEGEMLAVGQSLATVIFVPGHTLGHIIYYFKEDKAVFTGDTLFSIGCGRLFEGTADQLWESLEKILSLPDDTAVYCGHEYTLDNILFAQSLLPRDPDLKAYQKACQEKRAQGHPTIPTSLQKEKELNPFLAVARQDYRERIGLGHLTAAAAFAALREKKDNF